jgi:hypothetical protein
MSIIKHSQGKVIPPKDEIRKQAGAWSKEDEEELDEERRKK